MSTHEVSQTDTTALEALLTTEQVRQALAVSAETVRRMADAGTLPRVHVGPAGRLVRFRSSDVEALMAPADAEEVTT